MPARPVIGPTLSGSGRPLKRRLFNLAAAISLVFLGVGVALWIKSFSGLSGGHFQIRRVTIGITSANGLLGLSCDTDYPARQPKEWFSGVPGNWDLLKACDHRFWRFGYYYTYGTGPKYAKSFQRFVVMPYWLPTLIFSLLPGAWLVVIVRRSLMVGPEGATVPEPPDNPPLERTGPAV